MAHSLKPNTTYSIVTMEVAVPCTDSAELADWLNETLRPLAIDGQIADYSLRGLRDVREHATGNDPEEGEWDKCPHESMTLDVLEKIVKFGQFDSDGDFCIYRFDRDVYEAHPEMIEPDRLIEWARRQLNNHGREV